MGQLEEWKDLNKGLQAFDGRKLICFSLWLNANQSRSQSKACSVLMNDKKEENDSLVKNVC